MSKNDLSRVEYDLISLRGGLDLLTPTLQLQPGAARDAKNFEVSVNGGYTRIPGYERFDGRLSPSAATFSALLLEATATNVAPGDTITGPSGSGVVIAVSGASVFYTKTVGSFAIGQAITRGGLAVGTVLDTTSPVDARTAAQYTALASDVYRTDIQAVPGSGPVRGLVHFGGSLYAWRDNTAGTQMVLHRATPTGWSAVALGWQLAFDAGAIAIEEGDVVTGATSGATATVARLLLRDGTLTAGNAAGTLVFLSGTGTFTAGENLLVSAAIVAKATGAQSAITLLPGGRVQTVTGNFGGLYATRVYGCDNVNQGFEFDGTVYAPIRTGMPVDTPNNVAVHSNHLFFSFAGSLQFSSIGEPYRWSPIFGAGEIAMKADITALLPVQGSDQSPALVVYSRNETNILYGTSGEDFRLVNHSSSMGGNRYSAQRLDTGYVLDDRGIVSLSTTDKFGNFDAATLTYNIRPVLQSRRTTATAAGVNRERSQYRLFFADGYGLYMTVVNGQLLGTMPVQFPHPVQCWCEGEATDGVEQGYFGSTNGMVYRMDSGPSFDGAPIESALMLAYHSLKSPRIRKRYRRASAEITAASYAELNFTYEVGYGLTDNEQPMPEQYASRFSSAYWDSMTWDAFTWDGRTLAPTELEMTGTGENVALIFYGNESFINEFTLNSVIIHFSMRRGLR